MADYILLGDTQVPPLTSAHLRDIPTRRQTTAVLADFLNPLCQEFAAQALPGIAQRICLDEAGYELWLEPASEGVQWQYTGFNPASNRLRHNNYELGVLTPSTGMHLPVGDYGPGLAVTLWLATHQLVLDWKRFVEANADRPLAEIGGPKHIALAAATFQQAPRTIISEGIQSAGQALSQLSSYIPHGYQDSPEQLVSEISGGGTVDDFTSLLVFTVLATACQHGLRPAIPPLEKRKGELNISAQFRKCLLPQRQADSRFWAMQLASNEGRKLRVTNRQIQRGAGCPAHNSIKLFAALVASQCTAISTGAVKIPPSTLKMLRENKLTTLLSTIHTQTTPACPVQAHEALAKPPVPVLPGE